VNEMKEMKKKGKRVKKQDNNRLLASDEE